eukprot:5071473-Prymnesium_polylepis.1
MYLSFRARAKPVGGSIFHVHSRVLRRGTYVTPAYLTYRVGSSKWDWGGTVTAWLDAGTP